MIKARRAKNSASRNAEKRYHAPFIQYIFITHAYIGCSLRCRTAEAADHQSSIIEHRTPNADTTIDRERRATRRPPHRTRSGPRTPEKKKPAFPRAANKPSTERAAERPGWANQKAAQRLDGKLNTVPSRTPADGQRCVIVLRFV
ncbi:hypothetical protein WS71_05655 [Burkholderia mayonis]|uniref:Uncharacterized protein n=1 Tax=Burkholderia mayonis TaxID=1385591 RepID=A0A1B4FT91_9BURK|nr:hypothetical protein WS71_05655 [Burkholderia mayonis]KVE57624.1 hypothetical protein WS71_26170 [Burkholderia mayonis]